VTTYQKHARIRAVNIVWERMQHSENETTETRFTAAEMRPMRRHAEPAGFKMSTQCKDTDFRDLQEATSRMDGRTGHEEVSE
jgi:hypothetical protein